MFYPNDSFFFFFFFVNVDGRTSFFEMFCSYCEETRKLVIRELLLLYMIASVI